MMAQNNTKTALYRHFDQSGTLLYVGISLSAASRLSQHMRGSDWRDVIANVQIEQFSDRQQALDAEKAAIITEGPLWNKAHKPAPEKDQQLKKLTQKPAKSTKIWGEDEASSTLVSIDKSIALINLVISNALEFEIKLTLSQCSLKAILPLDDGLGLRELNPCELIKVPKKYSNLKIISFISWAQIDEATCFVKISMCHYRELYKLFDDSLGEKVEAFNIAYNEKFKPLIQKYEQLLELAARMPKCVPALSSQYIDSDSPWVVELPNGVDLYLGATGLCIRPNKDFDPDLITHLSEYQS